MKVLIISFFRDSGVMKEGCVSKKSVRKSLYLVQR